MAWPLNTQLTDMEWFDRLEKTLNWFKLEFRKIVFGLKVKFGEKLWGWAHESSSKFTIISKEIYYIKVIIIRQLPLI